MLNNQWWNTDNLEKPGARKRSFLSKGAVNRAL